MKLFAEKQRDQEHAIKLNSLPKIRLKIFFFRNFRVLWRQWRLECRNFAEKNERKKNEI